MSSRPTSSRPGSSTSGRTRSTLSGCGRTRTSSRCTSTSSFSETTRGRARWRPARRATPTRVSRSLGPALPDRLLARLMAPAGAGPVDAAIVLATTDPYGWAHPALLSYAEVLALDAVRLRLALHRGSRSSRHVRETGRATLVFADAELCLYV